MDGIINLLKPAKMTSHDAVAALRRILRTKKVGHTGTLDPMAAGVLPVCIGKATRAAEYLEADRKKYRCELLLGAESDTGDIWGNVTFKEKTEVIVTGEAVRDAVRSVKGTQMQRPPMYSAVRKDGKRLYEYAREGIAVEVEPREITVFEAETVAVFHEPHRVLFDIACSKGTYIRTICEDIGRKLGCGAVMTFLVRTESGSFSLAEAVTLEEIVSRIAESENLTREEVMRPAGKKLPPAAGAETFLLSVEESISGFGEILLGAEESVRYVNGGKLSAEDADIRRENSRRAGDRFEALYLVFGPGNRFLGTARRDRKKDSFAPEKVFYR